MNEWSIALRVSLALAGLATFVWLLFALVRAAKRGGKGVQAVGAMFMLFGWGNLRDPSNDTVAEAREGRIRKGSESGDPPD